MSALVTDIEDLICMLMLNQLWKGIKCETRILSLFRNKLNKFNNTGAFLLDSIITQH